MAIVGSPISIKGPAISEIILYNFAEVGPCHYFTPQHLHPYHQLDVVLDGQIEHRIEGWEPRVLKAGDALFIPPLVTHGMYADTGFKHISYKMYLTGHIARFGGDQPFLFSASDTLQKVLVEAGENFIADEPLAEDRIVAAGSLAVFEAVDSAPGESDSDETDQSFRRRVLPLLQEVTEKPFDDWTVVELSRLCHMSVDHFSKRFTAALQQTPQQFLLATRMRAAANELLSDSMMGIKEVAHRAGYSTVHTFSRAFKRYFNVSPGRFRKSSSNSSRL